MIEKKNGNYYNHLFDYFGGRGYFYGLVGILLIILWNVTGWDFESLQWAIGLLGLSIGGAKVKDAFKKEKEIAHVEPSIETRSEDKPK